MATFKLTPGSTDARLSAQDLDARQWHFAKDAAGGAQYDVVNAANGPVAGIIYEPGNAAGRRTTVIRNGEAKLKLGGNVNVGDRLRADAQGRGVVGAAGELTYVIADEVGVEDQIIRVRFDTLQL